MCAATFGWMHPSVSRGSGPQVTYPVPSVVVPHQPSDHGPQTDQSGPSVNLRPGDKTAALAAGELIDVAVRRPKMAPTAAALIHLPAQELGTRCLQLPHGAGEILDHKAHDGTGGEVLMVLVGWAEHLEGAPLRELEGGEVGPLLARGQPEDPLEEGHHGRVLACSRACPTNALDPHGCSPLLRCLAPGILPPRRWRS